MSTPKDPHHRAMGLVAQGFMAQMSPDPDAAIPLFEQALELEKAAIAALPEPIEPTYSVLHRSAGWMAFHCRQFRQAERLACRGLAGEPPDDIAAELRDLLAQIYFQRCLATKDFAVPTPEIMAVFEQTFQDADAANIQIHGILHYSDAIDDYSRQIDLAVHDRPELHQISEPAYTMNDLVRPMRDTRVFVHGTRIGNRLVLETIDPSDSS